MSEKLREKLKGTSQVKYSDAYQKSELLERMFRTNHPHQIDRGSGMINAQRSKEYFKYLHDYQEALGPERGGYIPLDADGNEMKNVTYYEPLLKKNVHTDHKGRVMVQNRKQIEDVINSVKAREKLITEVADECILDDNVCCMKLQLTMSQLEHKLGLSAGLKFDGKDIDCRPSAIRKIPPKSEKRLCAVHNLRMLVDERLDYVNEMDFHAKETDMDNPRVIDASAEIAKDVNEAIQKIKTDNQLR